MTFDPGSDHVVIQYSEDLADFLLQFGCGMFRSWKKTDEFGHGGCHFQLFLRKVSHGEVEVDVGYSVGEDGFIKEGDSVLLCDLRFHPLRLGTYVRQFKHREFCHRFRRIRGGLPLPHAFIDLFYFFKLIL